MKNKIITIVAIAMPVLPMSCAAAQEGNDLGHHCRQAHITDSVKPSSDITSVTCSTERFGLASPASNIAVANSAAAVEDINAHPGTSKAIGVHTNDMLAGQEALIDHSSSEVNVTQASPPGASPTSSVPPAKSKNHHYKTIAIIGATVFVVAILVAVL